MLDLQALNRESLVHLTVFGRKTGKPHTVKIWFATDASKGKVYVTSACLLYTSPSPRDS